MKKKKAVNTFKKIKKSDNPVTRVDSNTFYVKSSDPDKEPYFVYNSINEGWLCDCMWFTMNLTDISHKDCKHIKQCQTFISIV